MTYTGSPFCGVLNIGIISTEAGPVAIDFDVRFGDPETQAVVPLLVSDLAHLMLACVEGRLETTEVQLAKSNCVAVVICAPGYPEASHTGEEIQISDGKTGTY